jgi:hypothetical protein
MDIEVDLEYNKMDFTEVYHITDNTDCQKAANIRSKSHTLILYYCLEKAAIYQMTDYIGSISIMEDRQ